ncbi:MAG: imelysin family protein, partial [Rhodothermales bacterium]
SATDDFAADPSAGTLTALRTRLKEARLAWQDANLFQFGPAESVTLRAALNTYPVDEEQIEENVASGDYVLGTITNRAAAGFPAAGYLLYAETDEDVLARYTDDERGGSRMIYLEDVVAHIATSTNAAADDWSADGGNYIATFLSPDRAGTDVGSSLGMLINAFILHYERFLRDGKIGIPAGARSAGVPRPTSTEAYYGGYSAELALANLRAVKRLFLGTAANGSSGLGLDDHLQARDADALASEIESELDAAIASLEALSDPLADQIRTDNDPVITAFTELQDVLVLLKADMTSVLGVTISYQDNDGD